jgi:hypothetical protein
VDVAKGDVVVAAEHQVVVSAVVDSPVGRQLLGHHIHPFNLRQHLVQVVNHPPEVFFGLASARVQQGDGVFGHDSAVGVLSCYQPPLSLKAS